MDITAIIVALAAGIPTTIAAIAYALKKRADTEAVQADTERVRADSERVETDTTGRIVIGREADAETIRIAFRTLQDRLDRCERRHEEQERRHSTEREDFLDSLATKDAQIQALWAECRALRDAISNGGKRGVM